MNKDNAKTESISGHFSILTIFQALQEQISKNIEINQVIYEKLSDMNNILVEMTDENHRDTF